MKKTKVAKKGNAQKQKEILKQLKNPKLTKKQMDDLRNQYMDTLTYNGSKKATKK